MFSQRNWNFPGSRCENGWKRSAPGSCIRTNVPKETGDKHPGNTICPG